MSNLKQASKLQALHENVAKPHAEVTCRQLPAQARLVEEQGSRLEEWNVWPYTWATAACYFFMFRFHWIHAILEYRQLNRRNRRCQIIGATLVEKPTLRLI